MRLIDLPHTPPIPAPVKTDRRDMVGLLRLAGTLRTTGYDISSTCNLNCEGCFYFSGARSNIETDTSEIGDWEAFFQAQAEDGINYAYLAGAEPSLVPERLRLAARHIRYGMIFSNGTRRIPDDIPYRIHISMWGADETSGLARGANVNAKALRNYAGDARALFVYTIHKRNIGEIRDAVAACHAAGVPITFNYFSATTDYLKKLQDAASNDAAYFRFSKADDNLMLDAADFAAARAELTRLMAAYPDTVLYSLDYDRWVSGPSSPYTLDADGIAEDCAFRTDPWHRHFQIGREASPEKCGNPNVDCSECRTYAAGLTSWTRHVASQAPADSARADWTQAFLTWKQIFLGDQVDHRAFAAKR